MYIYNNNNINQYQLLQASKKVKPQFMKNNKKEDIETRLKDIQKILKENMMNLELDDVCIETKRINHARENSKLTQKKEESPVKYEQANDQKSMREQMAQIKDMLRLVLEGQARIQRDIRSLKQQNVQKSRNTMSNRSSKSISLQQFQNESNNLSESHNTLLSNFRKEIKKCF